MEHEALRNVAMLVQRLDDRAVSRVVLAISREIAATGVEVTLVGAERGKAPGPLPAGVAFAGLGVRGGRSMLAVPRLARWLRSHRPQVMFAHLNGPGRTALAARDLSRAPTRVVVVEHTHYPTFYGGSARRDLLTALLYRHADAIVGVSDGVAADVARRVPAVAGRVAVIPSVGPDPADVERMAGTEPDHPWFRAPGAPRVVCAVGNLVPRKGQDTLVAALPQVRRDAGDVRLLLIGRHDDPDFVTRLRRLSEDLGIGDRVDLPGYIPNPLPWIRRSSVLASGSATEGMGVSLVEGLACGVPVVSTDCPAGPAYILEDGRCGVLVPVGDARAMAEAIVSVLVDGEMRTRLAAEGRRRAGDFAPAAVARDYLELARACWAGRPFATVRPERVAPGAARRQ